MTNSLKTKSAILAAAVALAALAVPAHAQGKLAVRSAGNWAGTWHGQTRGGPMQMQIEASGDRVSGKVRSENAPPECPAGWRDFQGVARAGRVVVEYEAPGQCGKTELTYTVDTKGNAISGSWRSGWPSFGTFKLTKQPAGAEKQ